jgi:hypothetical protein
MLNFLLNIILCFISKYPGFYVLFQSTLEEENQSQVFESYVPASELPGDSVFRSISKICTLWQDDLVFLLPGSLLTVLTISRVAVIHLNQP